MAGDDSKRPAFHVTVTSLREATGDGGMQAAVWGGEGDIGGDHRQNWGNLHPRQGEKAKGESGVRGWQVEVVEMTER